MTKEKKEIAKILFVDDEENVIRSLKRLFMDEETLEVFTATSGKEGVGLLKDNDFAVIVSDQRMPEMTGAEFLEKARDMSPDSVRIVLTGYADINAAMDAINKGGAYRYITKPWNDSDLMISILNGIELYTLTKENKRLTELTRKQNEELKKWSSELEYYVQQHTIDLSKQNRELQRLNEKLKKNFHDFISVFLNLIELRNKMLHMHSTNVANIASAIAVKLGLSSSETETITTAALLHDIGMIGLPDIVLLKTEDELTVDEKNEYIKHPVRGQAATDSIEEMRETGSIIRHHHEWFNGSGFPDKLHGEQIPFGSRIIGIADKFDRLMTLSKESLTLNDALGVIRSLLNKQFDPALYKFLEEVARENLTITAQVSDTGEMEVKPEDLLPGMMVSKDVRSGTGLLLLSKGVVLNEKSIEGIRRCYDLDPSKSGIFVFVKRK